MNEEPEETWADCFKVLGFACCCIFCVAMTVFATIVLIDLLAGSWRTK